MIRMSVELVRQGVCVLLPVDSICEFSCLIIALLLKGVQTLEFMCAIVLFFYSKGGLLPQIHTD